MNEHAADGLPVGIVRLDGDGRVAAANRWFGEWAGTAAADLVGLPIREVMVDTDDPIRTGKLGPRMMVDPRTPGRAAMVTRHVAQGDDGHDVLVVQEASERYRGLTDLRRRYALADRTRVRLQLIMDSAVRFAAATDEDRLGEILAETTTRAYRAEESTVYLRRSDGSTAISAGFDPLPSEFDTTSLVDLVSASRRVVRIEGPDAGDEVKAGLGSAMRSAGIQSILAAPLHHEEIDFGAFISWFHHERTFDWEASPLAEALAGQAAQSLATLKLQALLAHAATHDEVTGLPNRRLLETQMSELMEKSGCAVLFIDLDKFKQINDLLGHHTGDRLLCEVANLLLAAVRSEDLVARYGGDEFVIACELDESSVATDIADRILAMLHDFQNRPGPWREIKASIGLAIAPPGSTITPDQLIRRADLAMYRAKAAGGDRVELAN
ncbi:hypothetical protein LK09_14375 [Microbacterium mangrovi]|uniref:GGDEF domain-containing protein n=1 Tax=Microbacterium mangrovi TaxID=1348253 RepID=A0A0B2A0J4_9MICO|nr:diguanylate cyclase [Microbacterium mangrovi]KHK96536.1 hypothetical protein LK09_14375 [Microbacterium mangrovi]